MMKNPHPSRRRVYVLLGFFGAFLVLFFAVLYNAQVVNGTENRARSISSNTASETVTASRGIITDRNGKVLVSNRLAYTLVFDRSEFKKDDASLNAAILRLIDHQEHRRDIPGVSEGQQAAHRRRQRGAAGGHADAVRHRQQLYHRTGPADRRRAV